MPWGVVDFWSSPKIAASQFYPSLLFLIMTLNEMIDGYQTDDDDNERVS